MRSRATCFLAGLGLLLALALPPRAEGGTIDLSFIGPGFPGPIVFSGAVSATPINGGMGLSITFVSIGGAGSTYYAATVAPPFTQVQILLHGGGGGVFTAWPAPGPNACPVVAPREVCVPQTGWGGRLRLLGAVGLRAFGGLTVLRAPLSTPLAGIGVGGTVPANLPGYSLQGTAWTTKTAVTAGGLTAMGVPVVTPLGPGSSVVRRHRLRLEPDLHRDAHDHPRARACAHRPGRARHCAATRTARAQDPPRRELREPAGRSRGLPGIPFPQRRRRLRGRPARGRTKAFTRPAAG